MFTEAVRYSRSGCLDQGVYKPLQGLAGLFSGPELVKATPPLQRSLGRPCRYAIVSVSYTAQLLATSVSTSTGTRGRSAGGR